MKGQNEGDGNIRCWSTLHGPDDLVQQLKRDQRARRPAQEAGDCIITALAAGVGGEAVVLGSISSAFSHGGVGVIETDTSVTLLLQFRWRMPGGVETK